MRKSLLAVCIAFLAYTSVIAQKVVFDPIDWSGADTLTITVDVNGTPLSGTTEDLYFWSWTKRGSNQDINSVFNGDWEASHAASKFNALGAGRYRITIFPEQHFDMSKELLQVSGFSFLVKNQNGSVQTNNLGSYKPYSETGIPIQNAWESDKLTRLVVDLTGTALEGSSGPLHYWGWYNTGSSDITSPNQGSWEASSSQSQMTRIGTSNSWYLDFIPTEFFATTKANLSSATIFGLVKTANGGPQSPDFGATKAFKKYQFYKPNASNVTLSPVLPTKTTPFTLTFKAEGPLAGYSGDVYLHSAVVIEGLNSTAWNYTVGDWGEANEIGIMNRIDTDTYQISIPSIQAYYGVPDSLNVYKIMAVFRNEDGSLQEKDGPNDYQLPVHLQAGLEIREPLRNFASGLVNEPFRITGYNPLSSDFELRVNNDLIFSNTGANRASQLYIPDSPGDYWVKIKSQNGASVFEDSVKVSICSLKSIQQLYPLPTGLKYGINYNALDHSKATLVLHAPTESISNVHVIGDFNDWSVACDYLMKYDHVKKVFWLELSDLTPAKEYVFQYLIDGKTRIADSYTKKVSDPWNDQYIHANIYPDLIPYPQKARTEDIPTIASTLQTNQTAYTWEPTSFVRKPMEQLNVYQLHFRDFTTEGTFLAAAEKLDYLERLGINAIATLPVSEFEGNDSWGYNPNFYFAVDKAYGTENDYKYFINECHKRGIAVLGDMVLNHAFGTNPMARMYWDELNNRPSENNPWFNAQHNFSNPDAQWGMDFNHTSSHTQAFVDSVIHYWVTEFKIDGIRFDFTKGFSNTPYPNAECSDVWGSCYDANRVYLLKRMTDNMRAINNGIPGEEPYVIMEHLAHVEEDKALANYGIGLWSGAELNHKYAEIAMGYAPPVEDPDKTNVSSAYYKNLGFDLPVRFSYVESHDEERIAYKAKTYGNMEIQTNDSLRSQFLQTVAAMNLLIPGPRQIWQFGELGYDYSINYNGRTGKKPVRWDYYEDPNRQRIFNTYAKLFWLRNKLPNTFNQEIDNFGGNKTDFKSQFKRYHYYNVVGDTAVTILANTSNAVISGNPEFNSNATEWFDFISGDTVTTSTSISLLPGEYRVFMNKLPLLKSSMRLSHFTDTLAHDSTQIIVNFSDKILRVSEILGREIQVSDLNDIFELSDSTQTLIQFSGTINGQEITITPNNKLPSGRIGLRLKGGFIQNYGGLKNVDTSFHFIVEKICSVAIDFPETFSFCNGETSIDIPFVNLGEPVDLYRINFDNEALSAGFTTIPFTSFDVLSETLPLEINGSIPSGTYSGTVTFKNSVSQCESNTDFTFEILPAHSLVLHNGPATQEVCIEEPITDVEYKISSGGSSAQASGLPSGLQTSFLDGVLRIFGEASQTGSFTYSVMTVGNTCRADTLQGTITVGSLPTTAIAGNDIFTCPTSEIILDANLPLHGTGSWSIFPPLEDSTQLESRFEPSRNSPNATFITEPGTNTYTLIWSIKGCTTSHDTLQIVLSDTLAPALSNDSLQTIKLYVNQELCGVSKDAILSSPNYKDASYIKDHVLTDNCGVVEVFNNYDSLPNTLTLGTYHLKWTAEDASNNQLDITQKIMIIDTIKPFISAHLDTINIVANHTGCSANQVNLTAPNTAYDNCEGQVTLSAKMNGNDINSNTIFSLGENFIQWTAMDSSGNSDSLIQKVIVKNPITLTLSSNIAGEGYVDLTNSAVTSGSDLPPGATLSYYHDTTATWAITNPASIASSGTYFIKAENEIGCSVIKSISVTVSPNPNCPDVIVRQSPTDDTNAKNVIIKVNQVIESSSKMTSEASVNYQAGQSITLKPGTEVAKGAVFKAEIKGCD